MSRKTRQYLFWSFFLVFSVISPLIILYARGYRFDFVKKKFVPTGAVFIKSEPPGAAILINGEHRGETSGSFRDAISKPGFISNLLPGEYDVRVELSGYTPWIKKLTVNPRQVTEARSVLLFAENIPKTLYFNAIANAVISPDGKFAAVTRTGNTTSTITLIPIIGAAEQSIIYAEAQPKPGQQKFTLTLQSLSSDNRLLTFIRSPKSGADQMISIRAQESRKIATRNLPGSSLQSGLIFTDQSHAAYLDANQYLRLWNASATESPALISSSSWGFSVHGERIYTLSGTPPHLYAFGRDGKNREQVSTGPVDSRSSDAKISVESLPGGELALLTIFGEDTNGTIRIIEAGGKMRELQKDAEHMQISPDGKKLLVKTWNELWVHYFDDVLIQPVHKKGDKLLVSRFGTGVKEAHWHPTNGDYILYVIKDGLFATELDDRGGKRNNIELIRNGDISILSVTREFIFFTAQDRLARLAFKPEKILSPTPEPSVTPELNQDK